MKNVLNEWMLLRTDVAPWQPDTHHSPVTNQTGTAALAINQLLAPTQPQPPHLICPVGSVCLLVTGTSSVPPRQPVPDLRLTHSISARRQDLIEAHTRSRTRTHTSIPCGIGQGLLRFTGRLPVDHSACLSPCVHI